MKRFLKICVASVAIGMAACGPSGPVEDAAEDGVENEIPSPAVWVASDDDSKLYMIGTVPMLEQTTVWETLAIRGAMADAQTFIFERDPSEAGERDEMLLSGELGYYTDGTNLADRLSEADLAQLDAISEKIDLPAGSLNNFKPWLVSEMLVIAAGEKAKLTSENKMAQSFINSAKIQGNPIIILDAPDAFLRDLADLPEETQIQYLKRTMDDFDGLGERLEKNAQEWAVGGLHHLKTKAANLHSQLPSSVYRNMIKSRNERWVGKLDDFLKGSENGVMVVSMPNLIDSGNLQVMLIEKGYTVLPYYGVE